MEQEGKDVSAMNPMNLKPKRRQAYVNANRVLPPDLVKEIQKHYWGAIWVSEPEKFFDERRALVIVLHRQNVSTGEISQLAGITRRRVNQILAEENRINEKKRDSRRRFPSVLRK